MAYKIFKISPPSGQTLLRVKTVLKGSSFLIVTLFLFSILLSACASNKTSQSKPAESTKPASTDQSTPRDVTEAAGGFMPACLNIVETEMRIEFDKSKLILQEAGASRELLLDRGEEVRCEKLKRLESTQQPTIEIVYLTRVQKNGTKSSFWERKQGLASLKKGTWIAEPTAIDRLYREGDEVKTVALKDVKWSEDKGALVLTRTDKDSKKKEVFRP